MIFYSKNFYLYPIKLQYYEKRENENKKKWKMKEGQICAQHTQETLPINKILD